MRGWIIASLALLFGAGASAQEAHYPSRPIKLVVGYPPAGATDIVARTLAAKLALAMPEVREKFAAQGAEAASSTAEEFRAYIRAGIEKWGRVIRQSGARFD